MKSGISFNGLRGKRLSLTLIVLICATILFWACEKTPLVTVLSSQNQLTIFSPAAVDHEINNEDDVSIKAVGKETKTEQEERNIELLNEHEVERRNDEAKHSGVALAPMGSETARLPEKRDVGLTQPFMEKDHEINNEDDVSIKAVEKETKAEREERNIELLNEHEVERRNDEAKHSGVALAPMGPETARLPEKREIGLTQPFMEKGCNYAKGKWVADSRRPLYSGFSCKQWLSAPWSCRLTQRTDFSYEGFRWQPENCEMPEFDGSTFLKRMQHKTVALVGDSLGRQQFQSLMCMVTGGKDSPVVEDVGSQYGLVKAPGAKRPDGWAYRFPTTNTTILYYWSASLCDLEPLNITDPATNYAMHLDRPSAFLKHNLHRFNVLLLNTGHHWNRGKINANRWVMYVGGKPIGDRTLAQIGNAKNFSIYSVVKWLDLQLPNHPQLKAFFRTTSPRHFSNGDWNTGGSCDRTIPLAGGDTVLRDESDDPVVAGAVKGTGVRLLDITSLSQLRDEAHMSRYSIRGAVGVQDCLHWCLPGIPDTWNEILSAQL